MSTSVPVDWLHLIALEKQYYKTGHPRSLVNTLPKDVRYTVIFGPDPDDKELHAQLDVHIPSGRYVAQLKWDLKVKWTPEDAQYSMNEKLTRIKQNLLSYPEHVELGLDFDIQEIIDIIQPHLLTLSIKDK